MDIFLEASTYLAARGVPVSEAAQEDPEDDQVFAQDGVAPSAREPSDAPSIVRTSDSSGTLSPLDPDTQVQLNPEKQLQRRRMVLNKVLENERVYILELESLLVPLRPLRAAAYTSQPVLTSQEIQNIFFKIPELLEIHREFHSKLSERVQGSDDSQPIADLFHQLVKQFGVYRAFVNNYPVAVETAEKCVQTKEQFRQIAQRMRLKQSKESKEGTTTTLEVLLHKPVNHFTRFTLLIREVLTNTPREHFDYCQLLGVLNDSNCFLSATNKNIDSACQRQINDNTKVPYLIKDGFAVEVTENSRKLRHIFLSTEVFFCARLKKLVGRQPQYKCEWSVPLEELSVQSQSEIHLMDPARLHTTPQRQIEETKAKLLHSKIQIYLDKKQHKGVDRLKKKLSEFESWLILNSPSIPLGLQDRNGKSYLFLVSSEFELHDWQETIEREKKHGFQNPCALPSEVQSLISSCIAQRTTHCVPLHSNMEEPEERTLRGTISLKIHSISGFTQPINVYCTFEADTNGYFEKKAQTNVLNQVTIPMWEEEIDIQLDGALSLRVLLWQQHDYRTSSKLRQEYGSDHLLNKAQIWLDPKSLHSKEWKELTIGMSGHEIKCSIRYLHQSFNQLEDMARALCATFGVPISIVAYRDRSRVPLIVRYCAEDVERRGFDELGIYRVSGIATDVQALKETFDRNNKDALAQLRYHDINAVAGTLKLYFRELPEPLLTDELIPAFVTAAAQEDPATKDKDMTAVLDRLPEPNLSTFLFLMRHLRRVTEHEKVNKMSLHNLATVFGPSLLRVRNEGIPMDISHEVVAQVQVVYYFLSDDNVSLLEQRERLGSVSMEM